jgi:hypothetical protein
VVAVHRMHCLASALGDHRQVRLAHVTTGEFQGRGAGLAKASDRGRRARIWGTNVNATQKKPCCCQEAMSRRILLSKRQEAGGPPSGA